MSGILNIKLKNKIIISIIFFVIVILSMIYLIVLPTIKDIEKISGDIEFQRDDLDKKFLKGQNLKNLAENLKRIEPELKRLDRVFINENRELEFITTLEEKASANNVTQKVNLGDSLAEPGQIYKKIPLQLITQGNFKDIFNYLKNLEAIVYYINIKNFEFSETSPTPASADKKINLFLTADTYWQ